MKASEAKAIAERNVPEIDPQPWLEAIYRKIEQAAKHGLRSVIDPLSGLRIMAPTTEEYALVLKQLRSDGYEVDTTPEPDPGHPMSRSYLRIRW